MANEPVDALIPASSRRVRTRKGCPQRENGACYSPRKLRRWVCRAEGVWVGIC